MNHATLIPAAKALLSSTIRALRDRLLVDLTVQAEGNYQLAVPTAEARLPDAQRCRRATLEAWFDERLRATRASAREKPADARKRLLLDAVKEVSATWLNRLVLLKHLEALGGVRTTKAGRGWKDGWHGS